MTASAAWPEWKSRNLMVETPMPVVDLDVVARNVARLQRACDAVEVMNRPHIKTHKSVAIAKMQVEGGAGGLTCQKLGEAEVMANAGFDNLLISYSIMGEAKLNRLAALARRVSLVVSCDGMAIADGLARATDGGANVLSVLVECDTGRGRCGVADVAGVVELARYIASLQGLLFEGLLIYPPNGPADATRDFVEAVRRGCVGHGLELRTISAGGTPNITRIGEAGETEYRSGTSVYNDRQMLAAGVAEPEDCALMVHATVVSAATPGRVMVDAGSKTLTSDIGGLQGYGLLVDYPQASIYQLAEEHGFVDVSQCARPPVLGEVVRILPNHVCPVSNLFDRIAVTRGAQDAGWLRIDARGRVD